LVVVFFPLALGAFELPYNGHIKLRAKPKNAKILGRAEKNCMLILFL
jgi:hypothetical protein